MARVRIKKLPKALSGLEIKMQPGLYGTNGNRQFTLSTQVNSQKFAQQPTEVRNTLQPVPRDEANLEAERGETAVVNIDGIPAHFKIGGKRHSQGGTPLNLPDNSFIFSDTAKMKIKDPNILAQFGMSTKKGGYTPAEIAKKYDINSYRKILADPNTEDVERKTAEMMISNYNLKLAKLGLAQESMKGFPQGIPVMAMPYVMANNINPADYFPTEGQEDEPDADTGEARYGGNMVAQFPTKRYGGLPRAQFGNFLGTPKALPKSFNELVQPEDYAVSKRPAQYPLVKPQLPSPEELDAQERALLGEIKKARDKGNPVPKKVLQAYDEYAAMRKLVGNTPDSPQSTGLTQWINAEGNPITDPRQGATGYWNRVMQNWSSQPDIYNIDPEQLDKISKQKGYTNIEVPTKKSKAAKEIVSKLNPYKSEGFLDYAGNLLSIPGKGTSGLLTGNIETAGQTYLRNNPGNVGTAMLIDFVSDPSTYVGAAPLKGAYIGTKAAVKQLPKAHAWARYLIPEYYTLGKEFVVKYGKKALDAVENLIKDPLFRQVAENVLISGATRLASAGTYDKYSSNISEENKKLKEEINRLQGTTFKPQQQVKEKPRQDATKVIVPPAAKKDSLLIKEKPKTETKKAEEVTKPKAEENNTDLNWD
jgi:hypothetical protein